MKKSSALFATVLLSSLSFASVAAVQVSEAPQNQQQIGIIGATTLSDLGSLEEKLGEKADRLGGTSFRITSAVGNHLLHGTAVVYQ
ncbi:YdgH/BhsA/McbA-like domain containing protein [uncultured Cedecea sp.]|uniref:multiple stress resistance protein BhsA n=1 Tax=uncultured Cedecea sp. TaxID=988762 RepID=UPI00262CC6E1|nr:YdgH/BhsA/McbA-like domain containing protein [uncultured Cedecea sp.]